jgi:hypothetical protein
MSTVLKQFDWTFVSRNTASPRSRSYPWTEWFDGRIHELHPGEDFDCPPVSLERVIRTSANRRGMKVRVRIDGENVVVQKHDDPTSERGVTKSPSLRSIKAAREADLPAAAVNGNAPKAPAKRTAKATAPAPKPRRKLVKA